MLFMWGSACSCSGQVLGGFLRRFQTTFSKLRFVDFSFDQQLKYFPGRSEGWQNDFYLAGGSTILFISGNWGVFQTLISGLELYFSIFGRYFRKVGIIWLHVWALLNEIIFIVIFNFVGTYLTQQNFVLYHQQLKKLFTYSFGSDWNFYPSYLIQQNICFV